MVCLSVYRLLAAVLLAVVSVAVVGAFLSSTDQISEHPVDPRTVYDPIVAGEQFPGGIKWVVARDGIRPVYEPEFVAGSDSGLVPDDLVIGVSLGDGPRAYPVGLLAAREMVNDWHGDIPVLVTWCPLCGTGTVHSRQIDGSSVLFGNQGALWGNAMTWWDHRTGSIWSQPRGEALAGPLRGSRLELLPSTLATWNAWNALHPDSRVLEGPVGLSGPYDAEAYVVVELGDDATAYPLARVRHERVINDRVGDTAIALVASQEGAWAVFGREVDQRTVTLAISGGAVRDSETGSTWDAALGTAVAGPLTGAELTRLPTVTVFHDDFLTFWPDGRLADG